MHIIALTNPQSESLRICVPYILRKKTAIWLDLDGLRVGKKEIFVLLRVAGMRAGGVKFKIRPATGGVCRSFLTRKGCHRSRVVFKMIF